ncbi:MAG: glycogen synthase GlgA [Myxococcaceae bacterium]
MKVLFVCSEATPFSKTGGLADVAGALPSALAALGHEVTVVTPLYRSVKHPGIRALGRGLALRFPFGQVAYSLREAQLEKGHRVVFVDQPAFFDREGLYQRGDSDYPDNHRRFGFFAVAALSAAEVLDFTPDVVHLNDWQCGLTAVALARGYQNRQLARARSVFTIHNLAYQGTFHKSAMEDLGLPWDLFTPNGLELFDSVSFLKAGLAFSNALSTVSPRYAQEIQTPEGGWGLDGFLRRRKKDLRGILNGVDYAEWNPETDRHLPANFSARKLDGKRECKRALLNAFGLEDSDAPVFGLVGRLVDQKGVDILLGAMPRVLDRDVRFVALGTGESRYERALLSLRAHYPGKVGARVGFDTALSHLVEAGSDFFVMPSRFEPCGLNQLYSLRYGTVPIVRAVGGLEDTVVDAGLQGGTGLKFTDYSAYSLAAALERALHLFRSPKQLREVRLRGMACDFSWAASAREYEALYRSLGNGNS